MRGVKYFRLPLVDTEVSCVAPNRLRAEVVKERSVARTDRSQTPLGKNTTRWFRKSVQCRLLTVLQPGTAGCAGPYCVWAGVRASCTRFAFDVCVRSLNC